MLVRIIERSSKLIIIIILLLEKDITMNNLKRGELEGSDFVVKAVLSKRLKKKLMLKHKV